MNLWNAIFLGGMIAGVTAILLVASMPRIRKEVGRSFFLLFCATVFVSAAIYLIADGLTGFSQPIDDHLAFVFMMSPLFVLAGLLLLAMHDRLTRIRFRLLVVAAYSAMLIVPVALIAEMQTREAEGPSVFAALLMSSVLAAPLVGFAIFVPIFCFRIVDWRRKRALTMNGLKTDD